MARTRPARGFCPRSKTVGILIVVDTVQIQDNDHMHKVIMMTTILMITMMATIMIIMVAMMMNDSDGDESMSFFDGADYPT